ncbi:MAG: protein phosphatase 2C domain-containing protein [Candidatus Margulisbacteria bacterium]|nr:protein phosphatase 2C domain-containing protein [Candidatus Margulisiibacteriota bacterium]MBU1021840.1 protein phosphatase 2C domain-containing protein [Candidatus Margulisiibacteriota bacterium]MBU1728999.1 protein phosphatase 2C domain-containing protein [Candidatus Margulisiibacteriota bacterium]MBU1954448.1 protein phosphatase 2C domain-containing protein [Candidatus Margulisiibacteriota bacterium]
MATVDLTRRLMPTRFAKRLNVQQTRNPRDLVAQGQRVGISWRGEAAPRFIEQRIKKMVADGQLYSSLVNALLGWQAPAEIEFLNIEHCRQLADTLLFARPQDRLSAERDMLRTLEGRWGAAFSAAEKKGVYEHVIKLRAVLGQAFKCDSVGEERDVDYLLPGDKLSPAVGIDHDGIVYIRLVINGMGKQRKLHSQPKLLQKARQIAEQHEDLHARREAIWQHICSHNKALNMVITAKFTQKLQGQVPASPLRSILETHLMELNAVVAMLAFQEVGMPVSMVRGESAKIISAGEINGKKRNNKIGIDSKKIRDRIWLEFEAEGGKTYIADLSKGKLIEKPENAEMHAKLFNFDTLCSGGVVLEDAGRVYFYNKYFRNRIFRPMSYLTEDAVEVISKQTAENVNEESFTLEEIAASRESVSEAMFGRTEMVMHEKNDDTALLAFDGETLVAGVGDGVGGHRHGYKASQTAMQAVSKAFADGADAARQLQSAHFAVWEYNLLRYRGPDKMPATTAVILNHDISTGNTKVAHAGDSRAYWFMENDFHLLTLDHNEYEVEKTIRGLDGNNPIHLPLRLGTDNVYILDAAIAAEYYAFINDAPDSIQYAIARDLSWVPPVEPTQTFELTVSEKSIFRLTSDGINVLGCDQHIIEGEERAHTRVIELFRRLWSDTNWAMKDNATIVEINVEKLRGLFPFLS